METDIPFTLDVVLRYRNDMTKVLGKEIICIKYIHECTPNIFCNIRAWFKLNRAALTSAASLSMVAEVSRHRAAQGQDLLSEKHLVAGVTPESSGVACQRE